MAHPPTPTPPSPLAPLNAPLPQASPKLSFTFPPHGGLGFYAPTCSRCRTWSYEIYQRTLSGQPYCVACLNAGAGLDEIEALVQNINLKALDDLSPHIIDQASEVV